MPEANRAPSPEALADLKMLARDHGISAELIQSLKTCKDEARAHIKFFKRMMFLSNGAVMTLGLALAWVGCQRFFAGSTVLGAICFVLGVLFFLKFSAVFASMVKAIKATEEVARKHGLV